VRTPRAIVNMRPASQRRSHGLTWLRRCPQTAGSSTPSHRGTAY